MDGREEDPNSDPDDGAIDFSRFPHDAFFKSVFSEPDHALRFFRSHLPPVIAAEADWDTLAPVPGSFVKSNLSQVHSDLLFSIRIGGRGCLLYLLLEHQSPC